MKKQLKLKIKKNLASTIVYSKKIAKQYHKTQYYEAMASEITNLPKKGFEKQKYSTKRKIDITKKINQYKLLLNQKAEGTFSALKGIYDKNVNAAFYGGETPINSNLLRLLSSVPMLVLAYRKIRKNKGALTPAWQLSIGRMLKLNQNQFRLISQSTKAPNRINNSLFQQVSSALRKGEYPWGASRRIYVDKPGRPGAKRPITIPPFMDKVVQTAILMMLQAIYEPWFELTNRSFGFRPNKGVHDAIYCLTGPPINHGMRTALEGDIKGAYDNVNRDKLIEILASRIKDRKFLNLIKQRLNYQYYDTSTGNYVEDREGIPQGGIDSPYLWNIYMAEFDNFVITTTTQIYNKLNKKVRGNTPSDRHIPPKEAQRMDESRRYYKSLIRLIRNNFLTPEQIPIALNNKQMARTYRWNTLPEVNQLRQLIQETGNQKLREFTHSLIKKIRILGHTIRKHPFQDTNKLLLKFTYCRYADDWILITSAPIPLVQKLKEIFKQWLQDKLHATMEESKTLITDITNKRTPAHFLGFEIRTSKSRKLAKKTVITYPTNKLGIRVRSTRKVLARTAGSKVFSLPDRQRLISRLHMKGYCNKHGFPKEVPWLSCLEPFAIIERFNSVLRGIANFYSEFAGNPHVYLNRWLYIIRFSCLKTLAQKYKTNIRGIFKRFAAKNNSKTIAFTVRHNIDGIIYEKTWKLLTNKEAVTAACSINRKKTVEDNFMSLEYKKPIAYININPDTLQQKNRPGAPAITDDNYLDSIKWVNLRTRASLDLPCCICGNPNNVEMHHIKAIRKTRYELLPPTQPWLNIMSLRNRKQIPVCHHCHINVIHKGYYNGNKLGNLSPMIMYDNRLIHLESYIKRGKEYKGASLEEKGWTEITNKLLSKHN